MKRILTLGVAASALCAVSAQAADLPSKKPPVVYVAPAPVFTWAGPYVGAYAGGVFGQDKLTGNLIGSRKVNASGFTGGGLLGYNYQFGNIVAGAEGEFGYNGVSKTSRFLNGRSVKQEQSYIGRVRARLGYAVMPSLLLYTAGGVSFTDDKLTLRTPNFQSDKTKDRVGWNIGAGAEYALTQNILARVEYIYDDYGKENYNLRTPNGRNDRIKSNLQDHTVRAALEYKFW